MNDRKIGTWLTRDYGTAVVICQNDRNKAVYPLVGTFLTNDDVWLPTSWTFEGTKLIGTKTNHDLIRKVSDSTELKPWKPEKRWRPWTVEEATEAIARGLFVSHNGDMFRHIRGWDAKNGMVFISGYGSLHVENLFKWTQHDGTPCGVEVEE